MFSLQSQPLGARTRMSTKPVVTSGGSQVPKRWPPVPRWEVGVGVNFATCARYVEGGIEDVWWLPLDDMINNVMVSFIEALE